MKVNKSTIKLKAMISLLEKYTGKKVTLKEDEFNGTEEPIAKPKKQKVYTIKTTKITGRGDRPDRENTQTGTLEELISYFSYTLEIGNSWNKKINRRPTNINSFVKNLQASYEEKEAACYDRTSVELVPNPTEAKITEAKKSSLKERAGDDTDYDALYKELVPNTGKAETVEGEILRAISKIGYRWYNDGDYYYKGYGLETCGSAYRYLVSKAKLIPGAVAALRGMRGKQNQFYEKGLEVAVKEIVNYIKSKNGQYTPVGENEDMLNVAPRKRASSPYSGRSSRRSWRS